MVHPTWVLEEPRWPVRPSAVRGWWSGPAPYLITSPHSPSPYLTVLTIDGMCLRLSNLHKCLHKCKHGLRLNLPGSHLLATSEASLQGGCRMVSPQIHRSLRRISDSAPMMCCAQSSRRWQTGHRRVGSAPTGRECSIKLVTLWGDSTPKENPRLLGRDLKQGTACV